MSHPIFIYCPEKSTRLVYVLDVIFKERLQCAYILTNNAADIPPHAFFIAYGIDQPDALSIPDVGLLWEKGIKPHKAVTGTWQTIPTLYAVNDNSYTLPFDLFSAVFFLLSRYEEYYFFTPDKHARYPATASVLYKNGWLELPIMDEWIAAFKNLLADKYERPLPGKAFSFIPTYDIDIAWSYKHKGFKRTLGGLGKDLLKGNLGAFTSRVEVLAGKKADPFDCFSAIASLHKKHGLQAVYFILAAIETTRFDKNIYPTHPAMQSLVEELAEEGSVGMHPSYFTNEDETAWVEEKDVLELMSGKKIKISRQHYVRCVLPKTYRHLLLHGFTDDYSMGYGTHLGFRCGTGLPFLWYDLEQERVTTLLVHPFCFMDATAHYENNLTAQEAFIRLQKMTGRLVATNSRLVTVFHNFSLGNEEEWNGWATQYAHLLEEMQRITS